MRVKGLIYFVYVVLYFGIYGNYNIIIFIGLHYLMYE